MIALSRFCRFGRRSISVMISCFKKIAYSNEKMGFADEGWIIFISCIISSQSLFLALLRQLVYYCDLVALSGHYIYMY